MEREIVDVLSRNIAHATGPVAVSPCDQPNVRVGRTHGFRKLDGLPRGRLEVEAALVVRGLISDLPIPDAERCGISMRLSLGIARVIAVSDPRGRFVRVSSANAVFCFHVLLASVRLE